MSDALKYKLKETNLAIVLLDLIGSTRFVQRAGPVKAARWLQYHDRLTRNLCYRFNGREIDRSDGFLMSFETTLDAVNFALKYQSTVPIKTKLQCRIGIHWGRIVEVHQHELMVSVGAKQVELEGVAKNIAARTMSLCGAGQVLLTDEAMKMLRGRSNMHTPKSTRYACVGLYKFTGVKEPQVIYAVGETIESLQPPKSTDKVKRLGGPKKIKKRARDRQLLDWADWLLWRLGFISFIILLYVMGPIICTPTGRYLLGLPYDMPLLDSIADFVKHVIEKVELIWGSLK